jgi:GcrA cell cycle regulator
MDDKINEMIDLWAQGLTGAEIAKRLGVTRSAVLGKIHRMREAGKLNVRVSDQRIRAIKTEARRLEAERLANLPPPVENAVYQIEDKAIPLAKVNVEPVGDIAMPIICEEPPEPEPMKAIPFEKLTPKSCRFVINTGNPADFLFCGRTKVGRSYCDEHMKLCYLPPAKKAAKE